MKFKLPRRSLIALSLCASSMSLVWAQADFAQQAAKEPGARVTASGLVFKSLQDGQGASPLATDSAGRAVRAKLISSGIGLGEKP